MPLDQSEHRMSYSRTDNIIKHNHDDEIRPRGWLSRGLQGKQTARGKSSFFSSYSSKMATDHHDDMMKRTEEDQEAGLESAMIRVSDDRTNDLDCQFKVGTFISILYRAIVQM